MPFVLLALALAAHVAALLLPFVDMKTALASETYGLLPSVKMLWDNGLPWLAALVVFFSIIFPFAKILTLAWMARGRDLGAGARTALGLVEALGKWSMLDIFLMCLLLGVTSGQMLVVTSARVGVPCFLVGVMATMWAGALVARRHHRPDPAAVASHPRLPGARWLLLLAALALLAAQAIPIMGIGGLLLTDRDFTMAALALALWQMHSYLSAAVFAITVLVLPWVVLLLHARAAAGGPGRMRLLRLAEALRRWSMLDVFAAALALFLLESRYLVPVTPGWGCVAILAAMLLFLAASWRIRWRLRRAAAPA